MKNLKGSEKQVRWAESIRKNLLERINEWKEDYEKFGRVNDWMMVRGTENEEKAIALIKTLKEAIENQESASFFIENRNNFRTLNYALVTFDIEY